VTFWDWVERTRQNVREHWSGIDANCKLNSLPFNPTGEKIQREPER
jgi:hypothetical protein